MCGPAGVCVASHRSCHRTLRIRTDRSGRRQQTLQPLQTLHSSEAAAVFMLLLPLLGLCAGTAPGRLFM